jgi:hypothetical protein
MSPLFVSLNSYIVHHHLQKKAITMHRKWLQAVFQLDSPNAAGRTTGLSPAGREAVESGLSGQGGAAGPSSRSPMDFDPMDEDGTAVGGTAVGRSWLVGAAGRLAVGVTAPGVLDPTRPFLVCCFSASRGSVIHDDTPALLHSGIPSGRAQLPLTLEVGSCKH